MARLGLFGLLSIAVVGGFSASSTAGRESGSPEREGDDRPDGPPFSWLWLLGGYRTVERGTTAQTKIGRFVYDDGGWRNATPAKLAADGVDAIDDVAFVDRRHGWVAAYNCATVAVYLYRTSDGGRSWQSLGKPASHSCGGGPTFLSFVDDRRGWSRSAQTARSARSFGQRMAVRRGAGGIRSVGSGAAARTSLLGTDPFRLVLVGVDGPLSARWCVRDRRRRPPLEPRQR